MPQYPGQPRSAIPPSVLNSVVPTQRIPKIKKMAHIPLDMDRWLTTMQGRDRNWVNSDWLAVRLTEWLQRGAPDPPVKNLAYGEKRTDRLFSLPVRLVVYIEQRFPDLNFSALCYRMYLEDPRRF